MNDGNRFEMVQRRHRSAGDTSDIMRYETPLPRHQIDFLSQTDIVPMEKKAVESHEATAVRIQALEKLQTGNFLWTNLMMLQQFFKTYTASVLLLYRFLHFRKMLTV